MKILSSWNDLRMRGVRMVAADQALPGRATPIRPPAAHAVLGTAVAPPYPAGSAVADFALGCFWGAEKAFWQVSGVWTTAVGYQGGFTANPTYEEVCTGLTGHAEAVRVVFDPATVTYRDLLRLFWEIHDPTQGMRQGNDVGTQYRSAIFVHDERQRAAAEASREVYQRAIADQGFAAITTEVAHAGAFFFAEDYHQQYLHKHPGGYECHARTGVACPI